MQEELQAHLSLTSYELIIKAFISIPLTTITTSLANSTLLYKSFMRPTQSFLKFLKSELKD